FLDSIFPDYLPYESYLLEVIQRVPGIISRLNVTGIDPATLRPFYEKLKELIVRVPSVSSIQHVANAMQQLRSSLSFLYGCVGESEQEDEFATANQGETEHGRTEGTAGRLLIPVVERSLVDKPGGDKASGYLREISVAITGIAAGSEDVFHSQVLVFGDQGHLSNLVTNSARAARSLLLRTQPGIRSRYFTGVVTFDEVNTFHQGSSANFAIASLIYCALLKHAGAVERYTLNRTVTATGDIGAEGEIIPVDVDSLRLKTEAVFFSRIRYFVIPKPQLPVVEEVLQSLLLRYPRRDLKVVGLERLEEVFYDRRLARRSRLSTAGRMVRRAWNNRYQVFSAVSLISLLLVLARNIGPGKDSNPVTAELNGNTLQIRNAEGVAVDEISIDPSTLARAKDRGAPDPARICRFYDVDGDGMNEFLYLQEAQRDTGYNSTLTCRSLWRKLSRWEDSFRPTFSFPNDPVDTDRYLTINSFLVGDFLNTHASEVLAIAHHTLYPCVVYELDGVTGKTIGSYLHVGHLGVAAAADMFSTGVQQAFVGGWNNAFGCAVLAVLDPRMVSGHSPTRGKYTPVGCPQGTEIYYIRIPHTAIASSSGATRTGVGPSEISVDGMKKSITLIVPDLYVRDPESGVEFEGGLMITFDSSMHVENVNSTTDWDRAAQTLLHEGKIRQLPDAASLNGEFKKSFLYWNGRDWEHSPVVNKTYLIALKERSEG
ncbi:MAG TPA: hypothetical protein VMM37_04645, partial [Bacteroidota bacterium]|nr:hypothetical protein [Bacteroidota bacterium]